MNPSSTKDLLATEMRVDVLAGTLSLALRVWPSPRTPQKTPKEHERVGIMYPGWLDNVGSFDTLAPILASKLDCCFVVVDPPGCGLSQHRPPGVLYNDFEECMLIGDVADGLGVEKFFLVGHSRGGGVTSCAAGIFTERVRGLVVLESDFGLVGTYTPQMQMKTPTAIRYRDAHENMKKNATRKPRVFDNLEEAIKANYENVMFPKTRESATNIVLRHVKPVVNGTGVTFTHDVRTYGQMQYTFLSEHGLRELLSSISCPVVKIMRDVTNYRHPSGMIISQKTRETVRERFALVKDLREIIVPGDHHVHSDNAPLVASKIVEWFDNKALGEFVPPQREDEPVRFKLGKIKSAGPQTTTPTPPAKL